MSGLGKTILAKVNQLYRNSTCTLTFSSQINKGYQINKESSFSLLHSEGLYILVTFY